MKCVVRIRKSQLDKFRKLAKSTNKEVQAYLAGKVISPELTVVEKFYYTEKYATQTTQEVQWFSDEYEKVRGDAEENGWRIVGDAHSHPSWWPVMSPGDLKSHVADGHRVCIICSIMNGKTKVFAWIHESSLPCIIEYAK